MTISRFKIYGPVSLDLLVAKGCQGIVVDIYGNVHATLEHKLPVTVEQVLGIPNRVEIYSCQTIQTRISH